MPPSILSTAPPTTSFDCKKPLSAYFEEHCKEIKVFKTFVEVQEHIKPFLYFCNFIVKERNNLAEKAAARARQREAARVRSGAAPVRSRNGTATAAHLEIASWVCNHAGKPEVKPKKQKLADAAPTRPYAQRTPPSSIKVGCEAKIEAKRHVVDGEDIWEVQIFPKHTNHDPDSVDNMMENRLPKAVSDWLDQLIAEGLAPRLSSSPPLVLSRLSIALSSTALHAHTLPLI